MELTLVKRDPDRGYLDGRLWVPKKRINVEGVKNTLTFDIKEKNGTGILELWRETEDHLIVPRAFWSHDQCRFEIVDCRPQSYEKTNIKSKIVLDFKKPSETVQREAVEALIRSQGGILQLGCGRGKTIIALETIARLQVPALVMMDNSYLMEQWMKSIHKFLDVPGGVGVIGDGQFDWQKFLVLATYQTMASKAEELNEDFRRFFGAVFFEEGHHLPAQTFCRSADLVYGRRYLLTATPDREDGLHVISRFHVGGTLYRNLRQDLTPIIYFLWTGFKVDVEDKEVVTEVVDKNGEFHLGKLSVYFGKLRPRLDFILQEVQRARAENRKILVLCKSVDECVNLLALYNQYDHLYTDIPEPTPTDVGDTSGLLADELDTEMVQALKETLEILRQETTSDQDRIKNLELRLEQHLLALKLKREYNRRLTEYRNNLITKLEETGTDAGLMIHKISAKQRIDFMERMNVVFAIMKYGKEGLDSEALDTVLVCEPMSDRNILQQVIGRALRTKEGKKTPIIVFFEDDVGELRGMCKKLRTHLREWPEDDGGPYEFEMVGHPQGRNRRS